MGRENSQCKGPETGRGLACWRDSLKGNGLEPGGGWRQCRGMWPEDLLFKQRGSSWVFLLKETLEATGGVVFHFLGVDLFFVSSGLLSAEGCVKRGL